MRKSTKVKQHDITDCGAACLVSVAAYFGLKIPLSRIRQYACTDRKGTNILGLMEAAEKIGFEAKGVRGLFESLYHIPLPCIAHLNLENGLLHYVVVYRIKQKFVLVMDPAHGRFEKIPVSSFKEIWTGVLVLLMPTHRFIPGNQKKSILYRFIDLIRPHKTILTQTLAGALIYSCLGLSTSIYVQKIVDYVLVDNNLKLLIILSLIMIFLIIMRTLLGVFKGLFLLKTGQKIDATLVLGYYKHLMKLPKRFFDTMRTGEIISRVNDAVKIRVFLNDLALDLFISITTVIVSFLLMFILSWKLTIIILMILPAFVITYVLINKLNKKYLRRIMERTADLESYFFESIRSIPTIKYFCLENHAKQKTEDKFIRLLVSTYHSGKYSTGAYHFSGLIAGLLSIIILWAGSSYVLDLQMSPGELMSFYTLFGYLIQPLSNLINMNRTIQDALIAADRLFQIIDLEQDEHEQPGLMLHPDALGDITFNNVSFRYGTRPQVFENLNLAIPVRCLTGIAGESGCGKSTLVSLLLGMYTVENGTIKIGRYDIRHICQKSLRKNIALVPQKVDLFTGSLLENIVLDNHSPDVKKVIDICQNLGLNELIEYSPYHLQTHIGENGLKLSGGERQKIAIARALYKEPEILILDEATSNLDSLSEKKVFDTLMRFKSSGKSIIIIAHRLNTIKKAEHIIFMNKGKVTESGTHDELIQSGKDYYQLWKNQFPVNIEEYS